MKKGFDTILNEYLFLVVILEGVLITFLQSVEGEVDFSGPPNLSTS